MAVIPLYILRIVLSRLFTVIFIAFCTTCIVIVTSYVLSFDKFGVWQELRSFALHTSNAKRVIYRSPFALVQWVMINPNSNYQYKSCNFNQRLTKTFLSLIDNQPKLCYTISVIKLQIQPKEAIIMMNTYIYRMSYVSPAAC